MYGNICAVLLCGECVSLLALCLIFFVFLSFDDVSRKILWVFSFIKSCSKNKTMQSKQSSSRMVSLQCPFWLYYVEGLFGFVSLSSHTRKKCSTHIICMPACSPQKLNSRNRKFIFLCGIQRKKKKKKKEKRRAHCMRWFMCAATHHLKNKWQAIDSISCDKFPSNT